MSRIGTILVSMKTSIGSLECRRFVHTRNGSFCLFWRVKSFSLQTLSFTLVMTNSVILKRNDVRLRLRFIPSEESGIHCSLLLFVVVAHHKESGLHISKTVWPKITKFCMEIQTGLLDSRTEYYNLTSYFRWTANLIRMLVISPKIMSLAHVMLPAIITLRTWIQAHSRVAHCSSYSTVDTNLKLRGSRSMFSPDVTSFYCQPSSVAIYHDSAMSVM